MTNKFGVRQSARRDGMWVVNSSLQVGRGSNSRPLD